MSPQPSSLPVASSSPAFINHPAPIADHTGERFIIMGGGKGAAAIEPWVACDELFRMDRAATVAWIASGELISIAKVIAFDLDNRTCRDATDEIAREVMTAWADDGEPLSDWQYEFVEMHVGLAAAAAFGRRAA
jgi:hypothetical protein